jgi:serine/threonine protein kinase
MAEVYLGRAEGPGGFVKKVVIKSILPEHAGDLTFVQMFLNEARLAALLNHQNIVQIFDFGEESGTYFLAMEYIEGESLRTLTRHHKNKGQTLPADLAARMMVGICEGLQYAHDLCDDNGVSFNIIHRDISPDNLLISSTGVPKIVDFGIAKAASGNHQTQSGQLKGKFGYMPPEQIRGEGIDRRLDIYALGITLHEALTGSRPFVAATDIELLHLILKYEHVPVLSKNPDVPVELAKIVDTATATAREDRFPDCRAFQSALENYLVESGSRVGNTELAALVKEVTRHRQDLHQGAPSSGPKAVPGFPPGGVNARPPTISEVGIPAILPPHIVPQGAQDTTSVLQPPTPFPTPAAPSSRRTAVALFASVVLTATVVLVGVKLRSANDVTPAVAPPSPVSEPTRIAVAVPMPEPVPSQAPERKPEMTPPPTPEPNSVEAVAPKPAESRTPKPSIIPANGLLTLRSDPVCEVVIGNNVVASTPLRKFELPAGQHTVVLRCSSGASKTLRVKISPGAETNEAYVFPKGVLSISAPEGAHLFVDGESIGVAPVEPVKLAAGAHEVMAKMGATTSKHSVRIAAGEFEALAIQ